MTEIPHDFTTEPIVAWRAWKVYDGILRSLAFNYRWPPHEALEARCHTRSMMVSGPSSSETPPSRLCVCGIYAVKTRKLAEEMAARHATWYHPGARTLAVGRVSLWGNIYECDKGIYRAQYAYPLDLMVLNGSSRELCRAYAVDELPLQATA